MNQEDLGARIAEALDTSTEQLSYRVSHRLAAARQAAVGRAHTAVALVGEPSAFVHGRTQGLQVVGFASLPATASNPSHGWSSPAPKPSLLRRTLAVVLPLALLFGGLVSVSYWDDEAKVEELADVNTAVLTGDTPLDTLTDRSFGVFVANSRQ